MPAVTESAPTPPPQTGLPALDEALASLDLTGPVSEHPQQLAQAVEAMQAALRNPQ
jgi:hypothetical protein